MISTRKLHRTAQLPVFCGRSKSLSRHLFLRATCVNSTKERFQKTHQHRFQNQESDEPNSWFSDCYSLIMKLHPTIFFNLSEYVLIEIYDLRVSKCHLPSRTVTTAVGACKFFSMPQEQNTWVARASSSENISTVAFSKKLLLSFVQGLAGWILNNDLLLSFACFCYIVLSHSGSINCLGLALFALCQGAALECSKDHIQLAEAWAEKEAQTVLPSVHKWSVAIPFHLNDSWQVAGLLCCSFFFF